MNAEVLFEIECPICRTYEVAEKEFFDSLDQKNRIKVEKAIKQGAFKVKVEFSTGCPKCQPVASKGTIKVLRPKK